MDAFVSVPVAHNRSALRRYLPLLAIATSILAADQVLKAVVTASLRGQPPVSLLGGLIYLDYTRNSGAAFGFFRSGGPLFELVAIGASLAILLYYPRVSQASPLLTVALGLILGGALGNLLDRIRLGYVVDFIDLRWWPVFNLADSAVVVGVALLVMRSALSSEDTG
jgi:signal peptidase II